MRTFRLITDHRSQITDQSCFFFVCWEGGVLCIREGRELGRLDTKTKTERGLCIRSLIDETGSGVYGLDSTYSATVSSSRRPAPGSVALDVRRSERWGRQRGCGGGGDAMCVPSLFSVVGGGVYGLDSVYSATARSGTLRSRKQPLMHQL